VATDENRQADDAKAAAAAFGLALREARTKTGTSLRDVARRAGLNSGYLSQLEHGKITYPSPSMLQKVAIGYQLRFEDVMRWAGYLVESSDPVSPNQAIALSTVSALGEPSEEELATLRAIVELLQSKRSAPYSAPSDVPLDAETTAEIRAHAAALLTEAGALGARPTPLEDVREAARLVLAGAITLDARDRKNLFERFGDWVHVAFKRLQGTFDYRASAIWVAPDLHEMKRRFVLSHEIGHAILPAHKQTFAYIDDFTCLPPVARNLLEREANQAAVEILFQAGEATDEFDSSPPTLDGIIGISEAFGASIVATARFVVETSRRPVAVAIAHRGQSGFGPTHLYISPSFATTYAWTAATAPERVRAALRSSFSEQPETWIITNRRGEARAAHVEKKFTGYAAIALIVPERRRTLGRVIDSAAAAVSSRR
jgi:transcriptional regulator with XRE-family HTH domain